MELEAKLWWYGPSWMKNSEERWPEWCEPQSIKEVEITTPKVFYEMTSVTIIKLMVRQKYTHCVMLMIKDILLYENSLELPFIV